MHSEYSDGFIAEMGERVGAHYAAWFPFCRDATLATVDRLAGRAGLPALVGLDEADFDVKILHAAWLEPFRSYLTRSGKYIRPYLVCLCIEAYGRDPRQWPEMVALAEIIHTSSLVLDDITDNSPFRRGGPTAHRQVGVCVAGACGASWMELGHELVWQHRERLGAEATDRLLRELSWEHFVTGLGTVIDVTWPTLESYDFEPDCYLQSVVHRSTSYTYRHALKIGALTGGAPMAEVDRLARYGEHVGLAFQLIDDILNVAPADAHWGKTTAEDITAGKITLQVLLALQRGSAGQRTRLTTILRERTRDMATLQEAVAILRDTGALAACRARAVELIGQARAEAAGLAIPPLFRERLQQFADYIVNRSR